MTEALLNIFNYDQIVLVISKLPLWGFSLCTRVLLSCDSPLGASQIVMKTHSPRKSLFREGRDFSGGLLPGTLSGGSGLLQATALQTPTE